MPDDYAGRRARGRSAASPKAEKKYRLGLSLLAQQRCEEAARAFEGAIRRAPKDPVLWLNLAQAHRKLGRAEAAEAAARRAVQLDPSNELARRFLADALTQQGRHQQAVQALATFDDASVDALIEVGDALIQARQYTEALHKFMAAAARKPAFVPAHIGMGIAFARLGAPQAASECYRTAVTLDRNHVRAWASLVHESMHACFWKNLAEDLQQLRAAMASGAAHQVEPFVLLSFPEFGAAEHRRCAQGFAAAQLAGIRPLPAIDPARRGGGRLRIGYLSNDFYEHATSYLLAHVLELHDRSRFEIFLYSYGPDDRSPMRRRIEAAAEHFVEMREMSARAMAERIRADAIDILVDLKGYTFGSRPEVLAWRPAPVQASFLGYPSTLGTPVVDYLITDRIVTPPEAAADYDENFAYLPDCYQPNDRLRPIGPPMSRAECGLPERGFVFCCFNNTYKITPQMFDLWCRLLAQVEGSVLWLLDANLQAKDNLRAEARARGADPGRLIFAPKLPLAQHLARLANADLVLDTLPYNAHTTASDALWAGVPVLTCPGTTFAARVAASLLAAAGLPEMIAADLGQYERIALRLAQHPGELAALRAKLRAQRDTCALFDSERYARNLEALYERMFERWRNGQRPDMLTPDPAAGPKRADGPHRCVCEPVRPGSARRPRVLLLDPGLFTHGGHNAALAEEFCLALRDRAELTVAAARGYTASTGPLESARIDAAFRVNGYARFSGSTFAQTSGLVELRRAVEEDFAAIAAENYDVVLMPTAYPLHLEALARRLARRPDIAALVGLLMPPGFWAEDRHAEADLQRLMAAALRAIRALPRVRVYSETGTYALGADGQLRLPVMLPPTSRATADLCAALRVHTARGGNDVRFGFFGAPFASKGFGHVIGAAQMGLAESARLVLRLPAGMDERCKMLAHLSSRIDAESRTRTNAEYLRAMADVDVVLVTYDPAHYAGKMSGIVPEAICLGKPLLLSDGCDALREFLDRHAPGSYLSVPYDPEAIRTALALPAGYWESLAACARASASVVQAMKDMGRYLTLAGLPAAPQNPPAADESVAVLATPRAMHPA